MAIDHILSRRQGRLRGWTLPPLRARAVPTGSRGPPRRLVSFRCNSAADRWLVPDRMLLRTSGIQHSSLFRGRNRSSCISFVNGAPQSEVQSMSARILVSAGLATALSLAGSAAWSQDRGSQKFITEAIEGNLAEVQMGQLAQKQGMSEGVRSFGQMLERDHSDANSKATAAAMAING